MKIPANIERVPTTGAAQGDGADSRAGQAHRTERTRAKSPVNGDARRHSNDGSARAAQGQEAGGSAAATPSGLPVCVTPPTMPQAAPALNTPAAEEGGKAAPIGELSAQGGARTRPIDDEARSLSLASAGNAGTGGEQRRSFHDPGAVSEWRQLLSLDPAAHARAVSYAESVWPLLPHGASDTDTGLARNIGKLVAAVVDSPAMEGKFTIELAHLGSIDGHLHIDSHQANVCLTPRQAATRTALSRRRSALERTASSYAGFDIALTIQ